MHWQQVMGSSNVSAIGYDADKKECFVRFNSGAVYVYENVSPEVWGELLHAQSKGRFVGIKLRREHVYRRVDHVEANSSREGYSGAEGQD